MAGIRGREISRAQRIFRAVKVLCMTLWLWIRYLTRHAECATPRVTCKVKQGRLVVMMCRRRSMECPTVVRGCPLLGRALHVERQDVHVQKTSVFSIQVCSEPKTALKKYKLKTGKWLPFMCTELTMSWAVGYGLWTCSRACGHRLLTPESS